MTDSENFGILFGEHPLTIDGKNRILIPAELRRSLDPQRDGSAFFVVIGQNRKPWLYPEKYYESLVAQRRLGLTPNKDLLAFAQYHFAMASRIEWDKTWRILLPEKTLARTGTGKDVIVLGLGDHLEIWNQSEWEARFEELLKDAGELASRVQQNEQRS